MLKSQGSESGKNRQHSMNNRIVMRQGTKWASEASNRGNGDMGRAIIKSKG